MASRCGKTGWKIDFVGLSHDLAPGDFVYSSAEHVRIDIIGTNMGLGGQNTLKLRAKTAESSLREITQC